MNAIVDLNPGFIPIDRIRAAVHDAGHSPCFERPELLKNQYAPFLAGMGRIGFFMPVSFQVRASPL